MMTKEVTRSVSLTCPLAPLSDSYCQTRIDVRLSTEESRTLRRLLDGLNDGHVQIRGTRRHVETVGDVVSWLLAELGRQEAAGGAAEEQEESVPRGKRARS